MHIYLDINKVDKKQWTGDRSSLLPVVDTGTQNVHSLGCISTYVKAPCLQGLIYLGILTSTACLVFQVVNYKHIMAKMLHSFGTFPTVCKICQSTCRRKIG